GLPERPGDAEADAGPGAGDEHDVVREVEHGRATSSWPDRASLLRGRAMTSPRGHGVPRGGPMDPRRDAGTGAPPIASRDSPGRRDPRSRAAAGDLAAPGVGGAPGGDPAGPGAGAAGQRRILRRWAGTGRSAAGAGDQRAGPYAVVRYSEIAFASASLI